MNDLPAWVSPDGARGLGMGGHQSAAMQNDHWLTPPDLILRLGPFDLDPCYSQPRPWPTAREMWGLPETNGLTRPWHGLVWCNPPYGREATKWIARLADHGCGIALIMARIETRLWFDHIWPTASAVLLMAGPRLHFHRGDGERASANCGAPTALIAYGDVCEKRLRRSGIAGVLIHDPAEMIVEASND